MSRWTGASVAALLCLVASLSAARAAGGANCDLSVTPLAFGRYVPSSGAPSDFTATLTVTCTSSGTTPVPIQGTIALLGEPSGHRLMTGTHALRYQLYSDPGRTMLWASGIGGGGTPSVSGVIGVNSVFRQTLTVYGRILARQSDAIVGTYADRITAVLNY